MSFFYYETIDNGVNDITSGGLLSIDVDSAMVLSATITGLGNDGSITLGAGSDAGLYIKSDDLYIENKTYEKDIIFRGNKASSGTNNYQEICRIDSSAESLLFPDGNKIELGGTTTYISGDNSTVTVGGSLTVDNIKIDGITIGHTSDTNLLTLASAALTLEGSLTVGVNDLGHDVKFFGDTSGNYFWWETAGGTGGAMKVVGNSYLTGTLNVGVDGTGHDVYFRGATSGKHLFWDASGDVMYVEHRAPITRATDQTENIKLVMEF